jgi:type 1 fimbriae regulatory protein FimE
MAESPKKSAVPQMPASGKVGRHGARAAEGLSEFAVCIHDRARRADDDGGGELAKLPFPIHPRMLRHACGFKLASEGQDTRAIQQCLGHRNITHTVRYTELSPDRFKSFWKD